MISFFRKYLNSWMALGLFGLLILVFAVTGFGTNGVGGIGQLGGNGDTIAKVGSFKVDSALVRRRLLSAFEAQRRQSPTLTLKDFMATPRVDEIIESLIEGSALEQFAEKNGIQISDQLIDREIADVREFDGPTGRFDKTIFQRVLNENNLTEAELRSLMKQQAIAKQITLVSRNFKVPEKVAKAHGDLFFEQRFGQVATISPSRFIGGAAPTDAELGTFYSRNIASYTVPETRVFRYATFDRSKVNAQSVPSEDEIAKAYQAKADQYAAKESRVLTQIITPDEAKAKSIAAKAAGGLGAAAKAAGMDAITLEPQDQKGFASLSSADVGKAAFAAAKGAVVGPIKSPLGWHVIQVDKVTAISGKNLAQAHGELSTELGKVKQARAFDDLLTKIGNDLADSKSFDDVVKEHSLSVVTTPAIGADGTPRDGKGEKLEAAFIPVLEEVFVAEPDDEPQLVAVANGERQMIFDLVSVNEALPTPLASIKDKVTADFVADRALRAARKAASDVAARVNSGQSLTQALGGQGNIGSVSGQFNEVRQQKQGASPAALLFELSKGKARMVDAADKKSFTVIVLDRIVPGDASDKPEFKAQIQTELGQYTSAELDEQLRKAIVASLKVTRNQDAIDQLKRSMQAGNQ